MDNDFLLILLLLAMKNNSSDSGARVDSISSFISTIELNNEYTLEKIEIIRKLGPFLPESYIPLLNKSIAFTEKFVKLNEFLDLIEKEDEN